MNPGPVMALCFFCILPIVSISLAFVAGTRYARHGIGGILPKIEVPDGIRILRTRD
jgi:hypothetical protein